MNFLQRRVAYFAFFAILWKWANPDAPWLQVILYFAMAFAVWQLRATIFRACLERLRPPIFVYLMDVICILLGLQIFDFILNLHFSIYLDLAVAFGFAALSFNSYRKQRNFILAAIEHQRELQRQREEASRQQSEEQENAAEKS